MQEHLVYNIKKSSRARQMRISVGHDMAVTVTLPMHFGLDAAENFVKRKLAWIVKSLEYFSARGGSASGGKKLSKRDYLNKRAEALVLARNKVLEINRLYNFKYNRVSVRNQKTRWGSCSKQGNINFNYKIIYLPENLLNYLVVHELCHLQEMNHSRNFWKLVLQAIPDYKKLRSELKNYRIG